MKKFTTLLFVVFALGAVTGCEEYDFETGEDATECVVDPANFWGCLD